MFPILIRLGPFTLHTYGLMVALGIFAALKMLISQAAKDGYSGSEVEESLSSLVVYIAVWGILGARLFYVVTHWSEFSENLLGILKIWEGGLVFYGGFVAAAASFFVWRAQYKSIFKDWKLLADWIAPSIAFGHALGRLGCFAAGCCYGAPTSLPWAAVFTDPETLAPIGIPLHPTQIYESVFLGCLGFFLLWRLTEARKSPTRNPGSIFTDYLILYSIGRFALECFRNDEVRIAMLSPGQIVSILILAVGIMLKVIQPGSPKNIR